MTTSRLGGLAALAAIVGLCGAGLRPAGGAETGTLPVTLTIAPEAVAILLTAQVTDSTATPVEGASIYLMDGDLPIFKGVTNAAGTFEFPYGGEQEVRLRAVVTNAGAMTSAVQNVATPAGRVFSFQTTAVTFELLDYGGSPLSGGAVELDISGWVSIGTTGADGRLTHEMFAGAGSLGVDGARMTYHDTSRTAPVVAPLTQFRTDNVIFELVDHNTPAGPLAGGKVYLGTAGWPLIGETGTDGQVKYAMFRDGSIPSVRVEYAHGTEDKALVADTTTFQTGLVDLRFSGTLQHNVTGTPAYSAPSEMLPGTHAFLCSLSGQPTKSFAVSVTAGSVVTKAIGYLRVLSSAGAGVPGLPLEWQPAGGAWSYVGGSPLTVTDADGVLLNIVDHPTTGTLDVTHRLGYLDTYQTKGPQAIATNSLYSWRFCAVTFQLVSNTGVVLTDATSVVYYWQLYRSEQVFGTMVAGQVTRDILPVNTLFQIKDYKGTIGTSPVNGISGTARTIKMYAGRVLDGGFGCSQYWVTGQPAQPFTDGMCLLAGPINFQGTGGTKTLTVQRARTLNLLTGAITSP